MRKVITISLALILSLALAWGASADVVHLKGGGKIEGKIVEDTVNSVTIKTAYGSMTFGKDRISYIEYKEYEQKTTATPKQPAVSTGPKACIIDIDGTIANEKERRVVATNPDGSTNWRKYFDPELVKKDKPILKSREVLRWVEQKGIKIFYVSSRETTVLEATKWWLKAHNFPEGEVYHRKPFGQTLKYKIDTIKTIQRDYDVIFGVGDQERDITAYQTCGIAAIKVKESSEEDWVRVENEIAKLLK